MDRNYERCNKMLQHLFANDFISRMRRAHIESGRIDTSPFGATPFKNNIPFLKLLVSPNDDYKLILDKYSVLFHSSNSTENEMLHNFDSERQMELSLPDESIGSVASHPSSQKRHSNMQMWCNTLPEGNIFINHKLMKAMNVYVTVLKCRLLNMSLEKRPFFEFRHPKHFGEHFIFNDDPMIQQNIKKYYYDTYGENFFYEYGGHGIAIKLYMIYLTGILQHNDNFKILSNEQKHELFHRYSIDGYYGFDVTENFEKYTIPQVANSYGCNNINFIDPKDGSIKNGVGCPEIFLIDHTNKLRKLFYINMEPLEYRKGLKNIKDVVISKTYIVLSALFNIFNLDDGNTIPLEIDSSIFYSQNIKGHVRTIMFQDKRITDIIDKFTHENDNLIKFIQFMASTQIYINKAIPDTKVLQNLIGLKLRDLPHYEYPFHTIDDYKQSFSNPEYFRAKYQKYFKKYNALKNNLN